MAVTDPPRKLAGRDAAGQRKAGGMTPRRFLRALVAKGGVPMFIGFMLGFSLIQFKHGPLATQIQIPSKSMAPPALPLAPSSPFTLRVQVTCKSWNASKLERTLVSISEAAHKEMAIDLSIICPPPPSQATGSLLTIKFLRGFKWHYGSFEVLEVPAPVLARGKEEPPSSMFLVNEGDRVSPQAFEFLHAVIGKAKTRPAFVEQTFGMSLLRGPQSVRGAGGQQCLMAREPSLFLGQHVHASCQLLWGDEVAGYRRWASRTANRTRHCGQARWEDVFTSYVTAVGKRNLVLGAVVPPGETLCVLAEEEGAGEQQLTKDTPVAALLPRVEVVLESPWLLRHYDGCGRETRQGVLIADTANAKEALDAIQVNNTLVLVTVNAGFQDMLANWLCFVKGLDISNVVIISMDSSLSTALVSKGYTVLTISPHSMEGTEKVSLDYGTLAYNTFLYERTHAINEVFKLGYHLLLADVDAVWLQQPFPFVWRDSADVLGQPERSGKLCGGFLFLKNRPPVVEFWDRVTVAFGESIAGLTNLSRGLQTDEDRARFAKRIQHAHEQTLLNRLLKASPNVQSNALDVLLFPHGPEYFVKKVPQRLNITPIVVHNNYIIGKSRKIVRFQQAGLWRIDDETLGCLCSSCGASHST